MDLPFSAKLNIGLSHKGEHITYDSDVFPKETNKTKKIGTFKPKTFLIKCDGNGHMIFAKLEDPLEKIEKLAKLKDKNIITQTEFEEKKSKLLDKIIESD